MSQSSPTPAPPRASAVLNRLSLCFLDAAVERDYRLQRAEASRAILRRFIIFMVVLVAFITTGIRHKLGVARAAGMPVPPQLDMGGQALAIASALALVLFLATLSRRFVPYLHTVTAACMMGLVLVDNVHSVQLPLAYALYGTILNLVVLYVASQLRFATASVLGVVSSLMYLCCIGGRNAPQFQSDPLLSLQMGVAAMALCCANLLLMFVTHQRELSARLAYHRARLLEQRTSELEAALSHLKQAELQLVENEKQATVGRLVAGILHEMNSPLGALSSATQTLERGLWRLRTKLERSVRTDVAPSDLPDPSAELLSTLVAAERLTSVQTASGERIRQVVEGLRQFVSLDQASLHVADVRSGLSTAVELIRPGLPAGVALELAVPERPIWVKCFPARLNQVFLNLLKNAVHALGDSGSDASKLRGEAPGASGGRIRVTAELGRGRLRIEIRDTGPGIEPERLQSIFDLDFSRQGSRVKLRLGLPASRGAVEAIGGKLTLESEVGRGSVAIIELPLAETPRAALSTAAPSNPPRDPAVAVTGAARVATAAPVS